MVANSEQNSFLASIKKGLDIICNLFISALLTDFTSE